MTVVVGFTGTQQGMTNAQKRQMDYFLLLNDFEELHHGDCIGADSDAHDIARDFGLKIVIHPPLDKKKRAFRESNHILGQRGYLRRNHDIVNASDVLIATPNGYSEVLRSGTWSTIRYARKMSKGIYIIYPDGSVGAG